MNGQTRNQPRSSQRQTELLKRGCQVADDRRVWLHGHVLSMTDVTVSVLRKLDTRTGRTLGLNSVSTNQSPLPCSPARVSRPTAGAAGVVHRPSRPPTSAAPIGPAHDQRVDSAPQAKTIGEKAGFSAILRAPFGAISIVFALATMATLFAWYGLGTWLPGLMQ
jgi:hypothetical protein